MRNATRRSLVAAGFSAALALAGTRPAQGQIFFQGNFPVPHGRISVGIGAPGFAVGAFVPSPYLDQIVYEPGYGYGFYCADGWVSVRSAGGRWIVAGRPLRIDRSQFDRYNRSDRSDRRFDNQRVDSDDRRWNGDRRSGR